MFKVKTKRGLIHELEFFAGFARKLTFQHKEVAVTRMGFSRQRHRCQQYLVNDEWSASSVRKLVNFAKYFEENEQCARDHVRYSHI